MNKKLKIILAKPRGFCAGVNRAIKIVESALEHYGPPVYVLHEIVHNTHVIQRLSANGAIFVEELEEIPEGTLTIFSAHGVSKSVVRHAQERRLKIVDATCPLVTKVHHQAQRYIKEGYDIVVIGHAGHPEVEGTLGRIDGNATVISSPDDVLRLDAGNQRPLAYVTQTTLSIDDTKEIIKSLESRFPGIKGPELKDICYATQSRQNAVRKLAREIDILLVVGSKNSSNSNRLREAGEHQGLPAYLIDSADDMDLAWFENKETVGLTAGASAPEVLVQGVIKRLSSHFEITTREMDGTTEVMKFKLPPFPKF